jgi:hypothetical protein
MKTPILVRVILIVCGSSTIAVKLIPNLGMDAAGIVAIGITMVAFALIP